MKAIHATTNHYDSEKTFFQSFLDPYMKYTSGLFEKDTDSLETGVVKMLDKLIAQSGVLNKPGARVLDIGSGWGSLLKRLKEVKSDFSYVGVTTSPEQNTFVSQTIDDRVTLITSPFETLELNQKFDAIFLVGSFCHLSEKTTQLKKLRSLLAQGGVILLEDTFFLSEALYQKHKNHQATQFVQQSIFGFAEIHSLPRHFDEAREAGLKVTELLEHSDSYKRTIAEWMQRLEQLDAGSHPLVSPFLQYMGIFQRGWNYTIGNFLITMEPLKRE